MSAIVRTIVVLLCVVAAPIARAQSVDATIVALERGAMDRWAKGDPSGFLELMAPDVTVFDAFTARRLDGIDAVRTHYQAFVGRVSIPRYEFQDPKVQLVGDSAAVLTYNFVAYGTSNEVTSRWNFTEVYRRTAGRWEIVQSHASRTITPGGA